MNKVVTSKEEIMQSSLELISEQGLTALSIRAVAEKCNIAVGSIYNYFGSKSDLLCEIVGSVWKDIFKMPDKDTQFDSFTDCVRWVFSSLREGNEKYPDFLSMHSILLSDNKAHGRKMMEQTWEHICQGLDFYLLNDKRVPSHVFNDVFTPRCVTNLILSLVLSALFRRDFDDFEAVALIERLIYN